MSSAHPYLCQFVHFKEPLFLHFYSRLGICCSYINFFFFSFFFFFEVGFVFVFSISIFRYYKFLLQILLFRFWSIKFHDSRVTVGKPLRQSFSYSLLASAVAGKDFLCFITFRFLERYYLSSYFAQFKKGSDNIPIDTTLLILLVTELVMLK